MELKYKTDIAKLECELKGFKELNLESFRWVFEDINDVRNFKPISINDPKRKQVNCLGFALSFFTQREAGIKRLKDLTLNKENLFKKLGTHISSGLLNTTDGIGGEPDDFEHFDFFEYENIELNHKFTVLEAIA